MATGNSTIEERRLKTLSSVVTLLSNSKSFDDTLSQICETIPHAYPNPGSVSVKISVERKVFLNRNYVESQWLERKTIPERSVISI